jgi:hypothetical protein
MDQWANVFFIVWLVVLLITWPPWFWFSVQSRRTRGEPLVPMPPAGASFCERGASGRARGNIFGNAHNCLQVAITDDELWITPTFPFNLIAPYGLMGLEYRTPKSRVSRAERRASWLGTSVVLDILQPTEGKAHTVELRLKSPDAFLAALRT